MLHRMNVEEMPAEFGAMFFDRWTSSYRDNFNDIFVTRRGRHWEMSERQAGNRTHVHSRHNSLERALTAANVLYDTQHPTADDDQ
jgi:hypothetical protein